MNVSGKSVAKIKDLLENVMVLKVCVTNLGMYTKELKKMITSLCMM